jgi:hypothetical protein
VTALQETNSWSICNRSGQRISQRRFISNAKQHAVVGAFNLKIDASGSVKTREIHRPKPTRYGSDEGAASSASDCKLLVLSELEKLAGSSDFLACENVFLTGARQAREISRIWLLGPLELRPYAKDLPSPRT